MARFAIGDVQGCYTPLRALLDRLDFDPGRDQLLLTGDLVNRGPESLQTLRFLRGLGSAAITVLGNHDLHLIAVAHGGRGKPRDTLGDILGAPDRDELLAWLQAQPLAWGDAEGRVLLVHAGVPPQWTRAQALACSAEVSRVLAGDGGAALLDQMYGDEPARWRDSLEGFDRLRFIINCLTRLRYCRTDGRIDLKFKGPPGTQPRGLLPWFEAPGRRSAGDTIVFGHWSTLGRVHWPQARVYGLDSGCVWGGRLTALNLDSGEVETCGC